MKKYAVAVVGGGPAGVAAAVSAARGGSSRQKANGKQTCDDFA